MSSAYYNEIDPFVAAWLRELIKAGHIAPGEVDTRSIEDVFPNDLKGFGQCHFFAGIGTWSYALRNAGWPDDRPAWTGSCPCQPFSSAGKGKGFADERHLWPAWYHLIQQCQPVNIFGEQVASKDGLAWFDLVQTDLEGAGYTWGVTDTCAAGFGAPHIRQRLYWVAHSIGQRPCGEYVGHNESYIRTAVSENKIEGSMSTGQVGNTIRKGLERHTGNDDRETRRTIEAGSVTTTSCIDTLDNEKRPGPTNGHWRDVDWLFCRDGKWRAVKPGVFPLADGVANRMGRLRGYGNAIVAPQAQAFVEAFMSLDSHALG